MTTPLTSAAKNPLAMTLGLAVATCFPHAVAASPIDISASFTGTLTLVRDSPSAPFYNDTTNDTLSNTGQQMQVGDRNNGNQQRALVLFDLSSIPADQVITSATLTLNRRIANGTGAFFTQPDLFASSTVNSATTGTGAGSSASLFDDPVFTDTEIDLTVDANPSSNTATGLVTADVLSLVQAEYSGDGTIAFRLQRDSTFNPAAPVNLFYNFDANGTSFETGSFDGPTLTVTFEPIPEPGSLSLLGLGALCMLRRRRRARNV